jgi:hypothetical protein
MTIRKHATRLHNLPDIGKTSSWRAISKVPKLFEQTTYNTENELYEIRGRKKKLRLVEDTVRFILRDDVNCVKVNLLLYIVETQQCDNILNE